MCRRSRRQSPTDTIPCKRLTSAWMPETPCRIATGTKFVTNRSNCHATPFRNSSSPHATHVVQQKQLGEGCKIPAATAGCALGHRLQPRRQTRTAPQQQVPRPQGRVDRDHGGERVNASILDASEDNITLAALSQPLRRPRQLATATRSDSSSSQARGSKNTLRARSESSCACG
jgi:hypothetical protein